MSVYHPELVVLKHLLCEPDSLEELVPLGIQAGLFRSPLIERLSEAAIRHYTQFHCVLTRDVLLQKLEVRSADPALIEACLSTFDEAMALEVSTKNVRFWYRQLKERQLAEEMQNLVRAAVDDLEKNRIQECYTRLRTKILDLSELDRPLERGGTVAQSADARLAKYLLVKENPEAFRGVMTGIRELDEETNGNLPGELVLFMSRHGVGKSIILETVARNIWLGGGNVIFAPIEMNPEAMLLRFDAMDADVSFKRLRTGTLDDEAEERYRTAIIRQKDRANHLYLCPQTRCTSTVLLEFEIMEFIRRFGCKPDAIVVDYLNILRPANQEKGFTGEDQKRAAEELRGLGIVYQCPAYSAVQSTRASLSAKPQEVGTEAIALSDWIGATADVAVRVYETAQDAIDSTLTFGIIKVRLGEKRSFQMVKNFDRMYIGNMDVTFGDEDVTDRVVGMAIPSAAGATRGTGGRTCQP